MANIKLIDKLTWKEICLKIMNDINYNNKNFHKWLLDKEYYKGTFFDSGNWGVCYKIFKAINSGNEDFMHLVVGKEGWGKSKHARQLAAVVDPSFCKERIFKNRTELYTWYKTNKGNTKGKAIIIDEGNNFFSSRESMTKPNRIFQKFLAQCRQANTYILVCVPSFKTIDSYAREHRVSGLTRITVKKKNLKYYNEDGIKYIIKYMKKGIDINHITVRQAYWFNGYWNTQEPEITDLNEEEYEKIKDAAWGSFLDECINLEQGLKENIMAPEREFLSVPEAAKITGLNANSLRMKCLNKGIPAKKIGEKWLISKKFIKDGLVNMSAGSSLLILLVLAVGLNPFLFS